MQHPRQDRTYHVLCYSNRGALVGDTQGGASLDQVFISFITIHTVSGLLPEGTIDKTPSPPPPQYLSRHSI